jgi:signal peptidase I
VALLVGSHWVVEPVRVESDSMSPTLRPGDRVVLLHAPWSGEVTRGDVVVVGPGWGRPPASADQGTPAQSSVKRVVAVAGDVVSLEDGALVVDGVRVPEPWVDEESMATVWFGPVIVPAGAVYVLGDDRARSVDSRELGPVQLEEVEGRVVTPWPLG